MRESLDIVERWSAWKRTLEVRRGRVNDGFGHPFSFRGLWRLASCDEELHLSIF